MSNKKGYPKELDYNELCEVILKNGKCCICNKNPLPNFTTIEVKKGLYICNETCMQKYNGRDYQP